jgi:hypothetical protein
MDNYFDGFSTVHHGIEQRFYNQLDAQFSLFNNSILSRSSTCFESHSAHPQEDIVYMQYLVFSRSVCWHRLRADCSAVRS